MKYLATTRGRRFTRRTSEKLCGIDKIQSRALKYLKEFDATEKQGEMLEHHDLAHPVNVDKPKAKPKTKTYSKTKNIKEDSDAL